MIRDKIVFTVTGKLQELLLREDQLKLDKTIKICRAFEQSHKHVKELREVTASATNATSKINKLGQHYKAAPRQSQKAHAFQKNKTDYPHSYGRKEAEKTDCNYCGYKHEMNKLKCPAWGKTCMNCKGRNHFKAQCKKKIHSVAQEQEESNDAWLMAVNGTGQNVTAVMTVNENPVKFQLDSAADVNTICKKHVRKEQTMPTTVKLNMWNKTDFRPIGETTLKVVNPCTGECVDAIFIVVPNGLANLLGLNTIRKMGLITVNSDRFISNVTTPKLGDLGIASLHVDNTVPPKILPCRKIPIAVEKAVQEEIDSLVEKGVLVPVTEPTEWVSQMAVVRKSTGKLRICIDPQPLNAALMREHYRLPVLDGVLPKLKNAMFSVSSM